MLNETLYKKLDNYLAWAVFVFAGIVFMMTLEPTSSFWDCGERITVSYKLQIGHPPGAPLYQMMARIFSLFALGDTTRVAFWINAMSAFFGALTISFLFRSITILARKIVAKVDEVTREQAIAIFGSGLVGALTLTFTDSFWFTAVEAEVYVTSLFLTSFVFWSILKWEAVANEKDSNKWLLLIAYIVGLSIGVHMLNLLAIPAIVFVYYFKKFEVTKKGIVLAGTFSVVLLGFIMNVLVPGVLTLDWWFERFFVNSLRLPFHSGTVAFFVMLIASIAYGLYYTHKHKKVVFNTIILAFTFIIIGYSSFFMLVVRSNAHVPINENAPKDALAMKAYLGREQYGSWPLLSGPYYNSPVIDFKDGNPVYSKNFETGRYEIINPRQAVVPVFEPNFVTLFPRMHSGRTGQSELHRSAYVAWGNVKGRPVRFQNPRTGRSDVINKPTFGENLRFFFSYQVGHMYWRYFMWNFAGRQNDIQGHGSPVEGNWITGIKPLDEARLGAPQSNIPESMTSNKGNNKYYMLPLILGIIGLLYHWKRNPKDAFVVGLLFIMTGLAIIVYLNQTPYQPRERDYSYIGSFYAFSIWVGLGVLGLYHYLSRLIKGKTAIIASIIIGLVASPVILAKENWDDHDRSGRYLTRDVAINYLKTCAPNAIIVTLGDNDTFPLWYAQEVEGVRTDIKIVNMSLLNADWYINNFMRRKTYEGEPLKFSMEPHQYRDGTRDMVYLIDHPNFQGHQDLKQMISIAASDDFRQRTSMGPIDYIPANKFRLPVDSARVVENGTVAPEDAHLVVSALEWTINKDVLTRSELMLLDFIAQNNWERPIYFAITTGSEAYVGLEDYFQLEGMAYRLVPIKTEARRETREIGRVNTRILYDNIMNKYVWGNINDPKVYLNEDHRRLAMNFRNIMTRLAEALIKEGENEKAIEVLDKAMLLMPESQIPLNSLSVGIAEMYFRAGEKQKGEILTDRIIDVFSENLDYYALISGPRTAFLGMNVREALSVLYRVMLFADELELEKLFERADSTFNSYYNRFQGYF
jgi:hypothetical protein